MLASFQSFGTWPVWSDMLNIISRMGEISWLSSFKTVGGSPGWGYQIWTYGFMWFQVGEQFLDAGGRYSDVWRRRVGTGPFVRKGARCFFRENWGELIIKYFGFAWCVTEGLTLASKRRDAGRIFAKMFNVWPEFVLLCLSVVVCCSCVVNDVFNVCPVWLPNFSL